jgi:hypothetical protein
MRRMFIALAAGLLLFSGLVQADGPDGQRYGESGTIVKWNAVVGLHGQTMDDPQLTVGTKTASGVWAWVEGGRVMLNLDTGRFQIQIRRVSWAQTRPGANGPIGTPLEGYGSSFPRAGTFVCDALGLSGLSPQSTATGPVYFDTTGSVNYVGQVEVPQLCRDYPDQIAFVFGGASANSRYFAYGAAREVLLGK